VGDHASWARAKDSELWRAFAARFAPGPGGYALRSSQQLQRALAADTQARA
jgi:hypothetical protein